MDGWVLKKHTSSLLLCVILLNLVFLLLPHPIHISVTEIEYSEKNKALQITSRIFIDDLELSIGSKIHNDDFELFSPKDGKTTDQYLREYLADHFRVKLDGKPVKINYLAHEVENPAVICYLEIENVKKFKVIEITNNVIQETHTDQSNLVHVTYKGPVKSLRLVRDKPTDILKFEEK